MPPKKKFAKRKPRSQSEVAQAKKSRARERVAPVFP